MKNLKNRFEIGDDGSLTMWTPRIISRTQDVKEKIRTQDGTERLEVYSDGKVSCWTPTMVNSHSEVLSHYANKQPNRMKILDDASVLFQGESPASSCLTGPVWMATGSPGTDMVLRAEVLRLSLKTYYASYISGRAHPCWSPSPSDKYEEEMDDDVHEHEEYRTFLTTGDIVEISSSPESHVVDFGLLSRSIRSNFKLYFYMHVPSPSSEKTEVRCSLLFYDVGQDSYHLPPLSNLFFDGNVCLGRENHEALSREEKASGGVLDGLVRTFKMVSEAPWNSDMAPDLWKTLAVFPMKGEAGPFSSKLIFDTKMWGDSIDQVRFTLSHTAKVEKHSCVHLHLLSQ